MLIANNAELLTAALDAPASSPANAAPRTTYAAMFRHDRERGNFEHLINALDFQRPSPESENKVEGSREPAFFSGNIASLSDVLSFVNNVSVTASDRGASVVERIVYDVTRR